MEKLTTISAILFLAADVFAMVALAMPDWIVDVGGNCFPPYILVTFVYIMAIVK